MALLQEVEQLIGEMELSTEQAAQMRAIFEAAPKAQEKAKGGVLRQSDYSKHLNEVQAAKVELEKKQTECDNKLAYYSKYGNEADGKVLAAQRAVEKAEAKVVAAQNRAKRWAENFGVPEEEIAEVFGTTAPAAATAPIVPTGDDAPMTIGEFKKQAREFGNQFAMLPAVQQKIAVEHFNLYGKFPEDMDVVVEGALKSGQKLIDYAAQHYKFPEKREQIKEQKIEEKYKEKYEKELSARLSEAHLPTSSRPAAPRSRIFEVKPAERPAPAAGAPVVPTAPVRSERSGSVHNRMSTVEKAVNAYREGKYAAKG